MRGMFARSGAGEKQSATSDSRFTNQANHPAGPVMSRDFREQNRRSWNAAVGAHESHRGGLSDFLKEGGVTLFPEERRLLGDLEGKEVLHLLCNAGGDSLSLVNLGAKVTGVDISDEAITAARNLSGETNLPAEFERADVCEWLDGATRAGRTFDVVYASYGVVCWLSDLDAWTRGIAAVLEPGGHFALVDFHPVADMFDSGWNRIRDYPSGGEQAIFEEGVGDYVGDSEGGLTPGGFGDGMRDFQNPEPARLFRWGLGEVVTALARAELRVSALEEYSYSNGERQFEGMRELEGRRMVPPERVPEMPLMYGVRAGKTDIS